MGQEKSDSAVKQKLANLGARSTSNVSRRIDQLSDGRVICVTRGPMAGGGWVATHEDVTERYKLEQQRTSMAAEESRRAAIDAAIFAFRERVETVLGEFANSAISTRTAAEIVLTASQSVESAVGNLHDEVETFLGSVAA